MNLDKVRRLHAASSTKRITAVLARVNGRPSMSEICKLAGRLNTYKKINKLIEQREARNFEFSHLVNKALRTLL